MAEEADALRAGTETADAAADATERIAADATKRVGSMSR
jgi:hypothetical protein